jgi:hypothetical protein
VRSDPAQPTELVGSPPQFNNLIDEEPAVQFVVEDQSRLAFDGNAP